MNSIKDCILKKRELYKKSIKHIDDGDIKYAHKFISLYPDMQHLLNVDISIVTQLLLFNKLSTNITDDHLAIRIALYYTTKYRHNYIDKSFVLDSKYKPNLASYYEMEFIVQNLYKKSTNTLLIDYGKFDYGVIIDGKYGNKIDLISCPVFNQSTHNITNQQIENKKCNFKSELYFDNLTDEYTNYLQVMRNMKYNPIYDFIHLNIGIYSNNYMKIYAVYQKLLITIIVFGIALKQLKSHGILFVSLYAYFESPLLIKILSIIYMSFNSVNTTYKNANDGKYCLICSDFKPLPNHDTICNELLDFSIKYYGLSILDANDYTYSLAFHPDDNYNISKFINKYDIANYKYGNKVIIINDIAIPTFDKIIIPQNRQFQIISLLNDIGHTFYSHYEDIYMASLKLQQIQSLTDRKSFILNYHISKLLQYMNFLILIKMPLDKSIINFISQNQENVLLSLYNLQSSLNFPLINSNNKLQITISTSSSASARPHTRKHSTYSYTYSTQFQNNLIILYNSQIIYQRKLQQYNIRADTNIFTKLYNKKLVEYINATYYRGEESSSISHTYLLYWELASLHLLHIIDSLNLAETLPLNIAILSLQSTGHYIQKSITDFSISMPNKYLKKCKTSINLINGVNIAKSVEILDLEMDNYKLIICDITHISADTQRSDIGAFVSVISMLDENGCCIVHMNGLTSTTIDAAMEETGYQVNIIAAYYQYFKKVYICKPSISNASSGDYYIIGIGFHGFVNRFDELQGWMNLLDNWTKNQCIYSKYRITLEIVGKIIVALNEIYRLNYKSVDIINALIGCKTYNQEDYKKFMNCSAVLRKPRVYYEKIFDEWIRINKFIPI